MATYFAALATGALGVLASVAEADLERQRQRPDRPLSRTAGRHAPRRRARRRNAAGAARELSRRSRLPARGRAALEAHSGTRRANRLPHRPAPSPSTASRSAARSTRDWRGGSLPIWQGCQVLPNGDVFLMNPRSDALARRPLFRPARDDCHHRPRRSSLDLLGTDHAAGPQTNRAAHRRRHASTPPPSRSFPAPQLVVGQPNGGIDSTLYCSHRDCSSVGARHAVG